MKSANFLSVLKIKNFLLFSTGQTISQFGDKLDHMALLALLRIYAPGPGALSELAIAFTLPVLIFGPVSGVLVDRWNRKRVLITCDFFRAILVAFIPLAIVKTNGNIHSVYAIVFVVFLFGLFFNSAKMAIIPNLVSRKRLLAANSVNNFVGRFATFWGMLLGGLLVDWAGWRRIGWEGWRAGFYLDSFTYFVSAILLASIGIALLKRPERVPETTERAREGGNGMWEFFVKAFRALTRDLLETYPVIVRDKAILFVMSSILLFCFVGGSVYVLVVHLVQQILGRGTAGVGMLAGAAAIGMICTSFIFGMIGFRLEKRQVILVGFAVIGILMMVFARASSFPLLAVLSFIGGSMLAPIAISQDTLLHEVVPEFFRGRIFSTKEWTLNGIFMLSAVVMGVLAELWSVRPVLFGVGLLVLVLSLAGEVLRARWPAPSAKPKGAVRAEPKPIHD